VWEAGIYFGKLNMLLNITVENFRSYNEAQTLSLIASENNGVNSVAIGELEVRKSAVIYGANASGKSNIIKAVVLLQILLTQDLDSNLYQPFFDSNDPTRFSLDFEVQGQLYTYQIIYDANKFHYEALLDGEDQIIFKRTLVGKNDQLEYDYQVSKYDFILNEEQRTVHDEIIKAWRLTTTKQQLFLRRCSEYGSEACKQLVIFIANIPIRNNPYMTDVSEVARYDFMFASERNKAMSDQTDLIKALNTIGAGFNKLEIIDKDTNMPDGRLGKVRVMYSHYLRNGKDVSLNFAEESDGTAKFYNYFAMINQIIKTDGVLIVDELETHFHPLLVEEIIRAIHNSDSKAQLIFTTHNPIFLDESIFEHDQIYFAAKDKNQATELYSLVDFKDLEEVNSRLQAQYITGKFGAIPYMHSLDFASKRNV
jgi:AAA15 family ATPase/GTPase